MILDFDKKFLILVLLCLVFLIPTNSFSSNKNHLSPFRVRPIKARNYNFHVSLYTSKSKFYCKAKEFEKSKLVNIPNILTVARVLSVPIFALALSLGHRFTGVVIYALSCLTDLLDGYIARTYNQTSAFGAFLDPVADKLMVSTSLIVLCAQIPTGDLNKSLCYT